MGFHDRKYQSSFILNNNTYKSCQRSRIIAASRKEFEDQDLSERYVFVQIAIESLGPLVVKLHPFYLN